MKLAQRLLFNVLILFFSFSQIQAQEKTDSSESIIFIRFEYGHYGTSGDFEERFQNSNFVGGSFGYKMASNWQFNISGGGAFSTKVRENNLLSDILNDEGDITDADGELVKVIYEQRGFNIFGNVSKIIPIFKSNPNSGIIAEVGVGFLQHQIKIDYRDGIVHPLSEDLLKGYDRLHNGMAIRQFIGYQYFGPKNLMNFYIGFEMIEAFTKNRRGYNYDTREFDKSNKTDLLYGLKLGWTIPIRKRASEEFYYY